MSVIKKFSERKKVFRRKGRWKFCASLLEGMQRRGDDFGLDVFGFHTCLTDILGFLEKLEWWFEQDIDDEEEKDEEGESGSEMEKGMPKDGLAKQGNDSLRM
ncbi:hypothetical protein Tco_0398441 [Tanacetum coccineum]